MVYMSRYVAYVCMYENVYSASAGQEMPGPSVRNPLNTQLPNRWVSFIVAFLILVVSGPYAQGQGRGC